MKNGAHTLAFWGSLIIVSWQSFAGNPSNAATQASSDPEARAGQEGRVNRMFENFNVAAAPKLFRFRP